MLNKYIGLEKSGLGISGKYFSYFSMKTYVVGTHQKRLIEGLLMSTCTYNICFFIEN